MNRRLVLISAAIIFALALVFASLALAQSGTDSQPEGGPVLAGAEVAPGNSDSNPTGAPEVFIPKVYQPSAADLATAAGQVAEVYFTPQDENTSTTVLFLYSTSATTQTVGLQTFSVSGSPHISTTIAVPAHGLVRLCADTVSTIAASWADAVLVNFTTQSAYAKMSLPEGVKADGYVVWNNASTYDPLQVAPTLPLRFSVDPPSVFLPLIQR